MMHDIHKIATPLKVYALFIAIMADETQYIAWWGFLSSINESVLPCRIPSVRIGLLFDPFA